MCMKNWMHAARYEANLNLFVPTHVPISSWLKISLSAKVYLFLTSHWRLLCFDSNMHRSNLKILRSIQVEMRSNKPLLKNDECGDGDLSSVDNYNTHHSNRSKQDCIPRPFRHFFILQAFLILGYTVLGLLLVRSAHTERSTQRDLVYCEFNISRLSKHRTNDSNNREAPAREALKYEKQVFHSYVDGNPFAGPPRPELDEAWHNLLRSEHKQLSALKAINSDRQRFI